jgi:GNAT superfamily N-acetyltransferase
MIEEPEISTDKSRLDIDMIHGFISRSYWAEGRPRSVVEKSVDNSLCFGAYVKGKQIAFARVVTDRAVFAFIADVFVLPEYRGRGIAKKIMGMILEHSDIKGLRLTLLATRDAHKLYEQFGFKPIPGSERMMSIFAAEGD